VTATTGLPPPKYPLIGSIHGRTADQPAGSTPGTGTGGCTPPSSGSSTEPSRPSVGTGRPLPILPDSVSPAPPSAWAAALPPLPIPDPSCPASSRFPLLVPSWPQAITSNSHAETTHCMRDGSICAPNYIGFSAAPIRRTATARISARHRHTTCLHNRDQGQSRSARSKATDVQRARARRILKGLDQRWR
jgi:hypothetical protein